MKFTAAIAVSILAQTVYGLSGTLHYHKSFSDVTEFYNEVNVDPSGQPYNSYFRANGFNGGYLGIQHNATAGPRGKRVVFSVSVCQFLFFLISSQLYGYGLYLHLMFI
jgi:hypothetical protein